MEFDRVDCFGKISVRIPRTWVESQDEEGDTCGFYDPAGYSGTLRVSLFRNERDKPFTPEMLQEEDFADRDEEGVKFFRNDDYVFAEWNLPARNKDVHMYFWTASAAVTPKLTRRALFSYAVPLEQLHKPEFQTNYNMVRDCVFAVHFMTEKAN